MPNKLDTKITSNIDQVRTIIADSRAKLDAAEQHLEDLTRQLARGTRDDVSQQARTAIAGISDPLAAQIAEVLAGPKAPMTFESLVRAVGASANKVQEAMRVLRAAKHVFNLGTEDRPRWHWVAGEKATTDEVRALVEKFITLQPMTYTDLLDATGALPGRVKGAIVQLQRDGKKVKNLGNARVARWFLPVGR